MRRWDILFRALACSCAELKITGWVTQQFVFFKKFELLHDVFTGTPSLIDERSRSRSDNWHCESEQRSRGCFDEGGCAARRLHADRINRFWRKSFSLFNAGS
jgi:hypothetical protein